MIEIDNEKGMIRFDNGEEMFIVPDKLDISVQEYFDLRMPQWVKELVEQLEQAQAANQKLVECLEWYADDKNHKEDQEGYKDFSRYEFDAGERARQALKEIRGEQGNG